MCVCADFFFLPSSQKREARTSEEKLNTEISILLARMEAIEDKISTFKRKIKKELYHGDQGMGEAHQACLFF